MFEAREGKGGNRNTQKGKSFDFQTLFHIKPIPSVEELQNNMSPTNRKKLDNHT
jgi:hypothetical protein